MSSYKIIPHTADIRLFVEGSSLKEVFFLALAGMNEIILKNPPTVGEKITEKIEIKSPDETSLLIDFLSEVLTFLQTYKAVFQKVYFKKFQKNLLEAEVTGIKVEKFDEDIKAVTYHEAEIIKNEKGYYMTTIVFDI